VFTQITKKLYVYFYVSLFDKHKNLQNCIEYMEDATSWIEKLQIVAKGHTKPEI
jgi:hypothetical protein